MLEKEQTMYAAIRRFEGISDPGEIGRKVNESFLPLISRIPGFVAYYWVDAGGGVVISTSIFQDKAGAEESNRIGFEWLEKNNLAHLFPKPQIAVGEVLVHKAEEVAAHA